MNKKTLVVIAVVAILLIFFVIKQQSLRMSNEKENISLLSKQKKDDTLISVTQQEMSVNIIPEYSENNTVIVHILLQPFLNVNVKNANVNITDAKIKNIKVSYHGPGDIKIIHPKHISRNQSTSYYYTPISVHPKPSEIKNEGDLINYKIVDNYDAILSAYDELGYSGGFIEFKVAIQNIANYKSKSILEKYGKNDSDKTLLYTGIKPSQINGKINFVLELKLDNNKTYRKKVEGEWFGKDLLETSRHTYKLNIN